MADCEDFPVEGVEVFSKHIFECELVEGEGKAVFDLWLMLV